MIIDDEVEEFLEHHGVKGMHWGHRKPKTQVEKDKSRARNKGIAIGLLTSGAVFASFLLYKKNKGTTITEVKQVNKIVKARRGIEIAKLIRNFDKVEIKNLPKHSSRWKVKSMNNMRESLKNVNWNPKGKSLKDINWEV